MYDDSSSTTKQGNKLSELYTTDLRALFPWNKKIKFGEAT
ncbi:hypothetical protein OROHE_010784 [Orobanche hederae]